MCLGCAGYPDLIECGSLSLRNPHVTPPALTVRSQAPDTCVRHWDVRVLETERGLVVHAKDVGSAFPESLLECAWVCVSCALGSEKLGSNRSSLKTFHLRR